MNFTQDGSPPPRNYWGFGIVLMLHIILIYALVNGLARKVVDVIQPPVETTIIKEELPPPPPKEETPPEPPKMVEKVVTPPPPKVDKLPPQTFVPKAEVPTNEPPTPAPLAVSNNPTLTQKVEPTPSVPKPEPKHEEPPKHVGVSTGSRSGCATPKYPDSALQNEESGITTLALLIGTDGKVAEAKIERSSGSKALDKAAMTALSLCTFKPATSDSKPVQEWVKLAYEWTLP